EHPFGARIERTDVDVAAVSQQRSERFAGADVPDLGGVVVAGGDEPATIGAEVGPVAAAAHGQDRAGLARFRLPQATGVIVAAGRKPAAARAEGDVHDRRAVL